MYELSISQQRRFLGYVKKLRGTKDACWIWTGHFAGSRFKRPYFHLNNHGVSPRRIAWQMAGKGELAPRAYLYPTVCRNVNCINPDHMTWSFGGNLPRLECNRGHDMTDEDNIYMTTQGKRACRKCIQITTRARRERYLAEGKGWGNSYRKSAA